MAERRKVSVQQHVKTAYAFVRFQFSEMRNISQDFLEFQMVSLRFRELRHLSRGCLVSLKLE